MEAVAAYVRDHPGCSKADVTRHTGSDWKVISRAIEAGLIGCRPLGAPPQPHRLYPAPGGGAGNSA